MPAAKDNRLGTELACYGISRRYYPIKSDEGIYTSKVALMRENEEKWFSRRWSDEPALLPVLSVISVAATQGSAVD